MTKTKRPFKVIEKSMELQTIHYNEMRILNRKRKEEFVCNLLKKKPRTSKQLMILTGIPKKTIFDITQKLKHDKTIEIIDCPCCEFPNMLYRLKLPSKGSSQ